MPTDMRKALKQAALLRNLIETCLKASPNPMTGRDLADWPSIKEQIGTTVNGYNRLSIQLGQLLKRGLIEKIGSGLTTTYLWNRTPASLGEALPQQPLVMPDLHIRVDKAKHSLTFTFEGLRITIEIAQKEQQ